MLRAYYNTTWRHPRWTGLSCFEVPVRQGGNPDVPSHSWCVPLHHRCGYVAAQPAFFPSLWPWTKAFPPIRLIKPARTNRPRYLPLPLHTRCRLDPAIQSYNPDPRAFVVEACFTVESPRSDRSRLTDQRVSVLATIFGQSPPFISL